MGNSRSIQRFPRTSQDMMEVLAKDATRLANVGAPTEDEITKMENEANKAMKMALLISGADKR